MTSSVLWKGGAGGAIGASWAVMIGTTVTVIRLRFDRLGLRVPRIGDELITEREIGATGDKGHPDSVQLNVYKPLEETRN